MITAIILAYNESRHIERCLRSVMPHVQRVVLIDSNSTDNTRELAASMGADVYQNDWVNYATQFNWGLDNANIETPWVFRVDADEVFTALERVPAEVERILVLPGELSQVSASVRESVFSHVSNVTTTPSSQCYWYTSSFLGTELLFCSRTPTLMQHYISG